MNGGSKNSQLACLRAARLDVRPNEAVFVWCSDVTICGCATGFTIAGLEIATVARGMRREGLYDRCLLCGACWTARDYRWQPTELIDDPGESLCRPVGVIGGALSRVAPLLILGLDEAAIIAETGLPRHAVRDAMRDYQRTAGRGRRRKVA